MLNRDHPHIEKIERTGYANRPREPLYCPVCGEELSYEDTVIVADYGKGDILGCRHCTQRRSAELMLGG